MFYTYTIGMVISTFSSLRIQGRSQNQTFGRAIRFLPEERKERSNKKTPPLLSRSLVVASALLPI